MTDLTTYTFNTVDIGTASATRYVLVSTCSRQTGGATVSSMTIGGVSAVLVQTNTSTNNTVSWWIANVPTGTTATIVVTWNVGVQRCAIAAWALENLLSTTATDTEIDITLSGNDLSLTIDVVANGGCFAVAFDNGGAGGKTFTWVGLTERFDMTVETSAHFWSGAHLDFATTQTGLAITATENITTGSGNPILSAIALR